MKHADMKLLRRLVRCGAATAATLASHEEWSSDTTDEIHDHFAIARLMMQDDEDKVVVAFTASELNRATRKLGRIIGAAQRIADRWNDGQKPYDSDVANLAEALR